MLTEETLTALVREAALRWFAPEDIGRMLGLSEEAVELALAHPDVQTKVQALQREMDQSGERFGLLARKLATGLLEEVARIACDDEEAAADRIKAASAIVQWAGLSKEDTSGVTIVLQGVEELRQARELRPWGATGSADGPAFAPLELTLDEDPH